MSFITDTQKLLDINGETVVVYSGTVNLNTQPPYQTSTIGVLDIVETATAIVFPIRGGFDKTPGGLLIEGTHLMFFKVGSSVSAGHHLYRTGDTDYYEVLEVKAYEDHREITARKVEGL